MAKVVCDRGRNYKDKNNNRDGKSNINSNLDEMRTDFLYHLALGTNTHDLVKMFGDVKYICMGGKNSRMQNFAQKAKEMLKIAGPDLIDISYDSHRFCLYKVGPIIAVSHGMGISSVSICLHETIKLMYYAKMKDAEFIRIGSSGGVGVEPGTVVISSGAVDGMLKTDYIIPVLGKPMSRPAILSSSLAQELENVAKTLPNIPVVVGKTMCASDFYEEQGRIDGAFCNFTNGDKMNYMKHLHDNGIRNIEMESIPFGALTHQAGVRGAIVCVALINRLVTDQVTTPVETINEFEDRPQELVLQYIKSKQ